MKLKFFENLYKIHKTIMSCGDTDSCEEYISEDEIMNCDADNSDIDDYCSGCEECIPEDEYEAYDEYYENREDGGYFLYGDHYLKTIPGYWLFCKDKLKSRTFTRHELNCAWKKLKEENPSEYKKYFEEHKKKFPKRFRKFLTRYESDE